MDQCCSHLQAVLMCELLPVADTCLHAEQVIDPSPIPAAQKAFLRDQLAALQKRVLEGQKKASAANKQRATQAAVADADAAVAAGQKYGVMRVDVGLDPKALLEAWNAIQKQHPHLPVIMFSIDQGKLCSRVLEAADVPMFKIHCDCSKVTGSATLFEVSQNQTSCSRHHTH